jgi:hypothetical protein
MTPGLISRLQDIEGVETVSVDLTGESGALSLRVAPDADEKQILSEVQALLVSYGVSGLRQPNVKVGRFSGDMSDIGLEVRIAPFEDGARIEVKAGDIQSARQVASTPKAIAQGLVDAWCQVSGRAPREVTAVSLGDAGALAVVVSDGQGERRGVADVSNGWANALTFAVGSALGFLGDNGSDRTRLAPTAW